MVRPSFHRSTWSPKALAPLLAVIVPLVVMHPARTAATGAATPTGATVAPASALKPPAPTKKPDAPKRGQGDINAVGRSKKRNKRKPPVAAAPARENPGKKAFIALQCSVCHTVSKRGMGKNRGPGSPPDLSSVGTRYTAASLRSWLRPEPNMRGHKHPFPFSGTDKQLRDVIAWLLTLK